MDGNFFNDAKSIDGVMNNFKQLSISNDGACGSCNSPPPYDGRKIRKSRKRRSRSKNRRKSKKKSRKHRS